MMGEQSHLRQSSWEAENESLHLTKAIASLSVSQDSLSVFHDSPFPYSMTLQYPLIIFI